MNTDTYKILKLISGENIICELSENNGKYEISKPLLMSVHPHVTRTGITESLMLTRWVQPFTEQTYFDIDPKHVIIMLPASPGLSVYYEGIINKLDDAEEINTLDDIDDDDVYDDLLEDLKTDIKYIH
tara:strand:+ start:641 stop:1024 length:384 start_codon:yes stop_codon:yes gene_type:complete